MASPDRFGDAVTRLSAYLGGASSDDSAREDYELVRDGLARYLATRFRTLGPDEALDIADEGILRLTRESQTRGQPIRNAPGWLSLVARRLAIDLLRRNSREPSANDSLTDDAVSALLDQQATSAAVHAAARRAVAASDHQCVRVIAEWLDLANETGEPPSSRLVAARTGYSHTTVNAALSRFRAYLEEDL